MKLIYTERINMVRNGLNNPSNTKNTKKRKKKRKKVERNVKECVLNHIRDLRILRVWE